MKNNSITRGDKSIKEHVRNGSGTLCKSASINRVHRDDFIRYLVEYPDICCKRCASKLHR